MFLCAVAARSHYNRIVMSAESAVVFKVTGKTGISHEFPEMSKAGSTTMGQLQSFFQKKLKLPVVHFFIMQGSEGFIPTPDQTLETLRSLYAIEDDTGKKILSFAVSTQIFQG